MHINCTLKKIISKVCKYELNKKSAKIIVIKFYAYAAVFRLKPPLTELFKTSILTLYFTLHESWLRPEIQAIKT